jgi:TonB-dependent SusC/RagA subfamily outer membrane receptor
MKRIVIFITMLFVVIATTNAQTKIVNGVVHTLDSFPLIGAEVKVLSSGNIYLTDVNGMFTAETEAKDKLHIKAEGFNNRKVKLDDKVRFIAVNLNVKSGNSRDYNIGYGNTTESNRSSAISSISYKDLNFTRYNTVFDLIRDNFSGVQVNGSDIIVRGISSLTSSNAALVVIDGVITDGTYLSTLSPVTIKRIDIIKDASTAVYGSRGANGVVLIETMKGGEL